MPGVGALLGHRSGTELTRGHGTHGANGTPRHIGAGNQLDDVLAPGLIRHRLELAMGGQHDAGIGAALHRIDATHRRCEIRHVQRALQASRQIDVAHLDHHARAVRAHIRHRAFTVEAQHQLARPTFAAVEVDVIDRNRSGELFGRVASRHGNLQGCHPWRDAGRLRCVRCGRRGQQAHRQAECGRTERLDATRRPRILPVAHHLTSPNP